MELVGVARPIVRCGEVSGVGRGGQVFQRRVRPPDIVVGAHGAILARALSRSKNRVSLSSSSRMRPLKLSMKPFCIGFPGTIKCQSMTVSLLQASMALQVNSVLWPDTTFLACCAA